MYAGTVYVGGRVGDLGADAVDGEMEPGERDMLHAHLDRWKVPAPARFRKLIAGRKLWNFQRADLHLWKEAL
jgi:hypothetical protein